MERRKRSRIWTIPKNELLEVLNKSSSFTEVLKRFGFLSICGNIKTLKARLDAEGISYEKILINYSKRRPPKPQKLNTGEVLVKNSKYPRRTVREIVVRDRLLPYKCSICGLKDEWNGKPLHLVLDHINGNPTDHRLENLRWLCPNCNSQTDTFCGRKNRIQKEYKACFECGRKISCGNKTGLCPRCAAKKARLDKKSSFDEAAKKNRKVVRPSKSELLQLISSSSMESIGRKFGVSGTAVKKWAKSYEIFEYRKFKRRVE